MARLRPVTVLTAAVVVTSTLLLAAPALAGMQGDDGLSAAPVPQTPGASAAGPTFSSTAAITLPNSTTAPAPASPYPSGIAVSGLPDVTGLTVTLAGVSVPDSRELAVALESPSGRTLQLLGGVGPASGSAAASDVTVTFSDAAPSAIAPGAPLGTAGSSVTTTPVDDAGAAQPFPSPAPADIAAPAPAGSATLASVFAGADPDGTWTLFVTSQAPDAGAGSVARGWSLTFARSPQTVTFTSSAPTDATVGGATYIPHATATSDLPVTLSVDPTAAKVCAQSGSGAVSFLEAGSCVLDANQAGNGIYAPADQVQQSVTVGPGTPAVALTADPPVSVALGRSTTFTATVTGATGSPVPTGSVAFSDTDGPILGCGTQALSSTSPPTATCTTTPLSAGAQSVSASYSGDANYTSASSAALPYAVALAGTSTTVSSLTGPSRYGEPVVVRASVSSGVAGTVQFSVDGADVGAPVTVASGTATSPPLTVDSGPLPVGERSVGALFVPGDSTLDASSSATLTQQVSAAATATTVTVAADAVSAAVTAVAPGQGTPGGSVSFSVGGVTVGSAALAAGTATLAYRTPPGATRVVTATYTGNADYTGSTGRATRRDPLIRVTVSSAHARTRYGWYRTPVRLTFTCTTQGSPLVGGCPAPVVLSRSARGQRVTRTVTAANGGQASVTVAGIDIDRTPPTVRVLGVVDGRTYHGSPPRIRCEARDALSGVATCTVQESTSGEITRYRVTAVDRAGNSRTVSGQFLLAPAASAAAAARRSYSGTATIS